MPPAAFDIARIEEIEQTTQHDVIAFTTAVAERVGPRRAGFISVTSSDVVDTAQAIQMGEAERPIVKDHRGPMDAVRARLRSTGTRR